MSDNIVLAVDLGGTNLRMAAVDRDGAILSHDDVKTDTVKDPSGLMRALMGLAERCRSLLPADAKIIGIGAGVPANITPDGILHNLPNLHQLEGMDLERELTAQFNLPVVLENDATAAAIGEKWLGASKDVQDWIMITLGTGVGGGIIINNELLRGIDDLAGKLGHICVEPDGYRCGCGSNGCIEQYASATAIVRMANESGLNVSTSLDVYRLATGSYSGSPPYQEGMAAASVDGVVLSSEETKTAAQTVFANVGRHLGIMLGGLVNALNPEMIVIGGGVAAAWDVFISPLTAELRYRAFNEPADRVRIVRGTLGDNAGILGVAHSAFIRL